MQKIPRILAVLAIVAASLYFVHRVQERSIAGVQPAEPTPAAQPAPAPAAVPGGAAQVPELIYPDAKASRALALGYEAYTAHGDGTIMVLPLPPGTALQTTLSLTAAKPALRVEMTDARCAAPVHVAAYRVDRREPVATLTLQASAQSGPQRLDLGGLGGGQPALLTISMAAQAQNNWHCNLSLAWTE